MCWHCLEISRRDMLKCVAAAAGALALAQCGSDESTHALPDVYEDHLFGPAGNAPGAVKIDPKRIVVPPPVAPQKSDYGDIMPRAAWTRVPLQLRDGVNLDGVARITIHHSGDGKPFLGESVADVARHLQVVQQAHLQRGMIDIAYHFAIDRTGRAWQLRWLQYEGQHVRNSVNGTRNNAHNVGVVVLGDFNLQPATVAQRDRVINMVRLLRAKYTPAPPTRSAAPAISMHGELVSTDCPGKQLAPLIIDARKKGLV